MPVIYIRLKDQSETVFFQIIFGSYSHLAWVRTEDPETGVTMIITTPDLVDETRAALKRLAEEVEFEEMAPPSPQE